MATKRLALEHTNLQRDPPETFTAGPAEGDNPLLWNAKVSGPPDTPYAQRSYSLTIRFPENYPNEAVQLTFVTPIFHPNVSREGEVVLEEMESENWSPVLTVRSILLSLQAMLSDPDPLDGILNQEAADLYLRDVEAFKEKAKEEQAKEEQAKKEVAV